MNCERIALTCAPGGENHTGNQFIGKMPTKGSGFTSKDLEKIANHISSERKKLFIENLTEKKIKNIDDIDDELCIDLGVELLDLNKMSRNEIITDIGDKDESEHATVLIVRNWVKDTESIYNECVQDEWDKKYLDPNKYREEIIDGEKVRVRGRVLNKHARSNICYVEDTEQSPDYLNGKGTIIDLCKKKHMMAEINKLKELNDVLSENDDKDKFQINVVEGNRYYDLKKTGIGFHGDTERSIVMCLTIGGGGGYPMRWQWFKNGFPTGNCIDITLNDGDLYIMSEKSVGMDWKLRSKYTLRHSAGADKFTSLKKWEKRLQDRANGKKTKSKGFGNITI